MVGTVLQVSPNYDFVSVQLAGYDTASSFPTSALKKAEESEPRMAQGEQMYLVRNNDTGQEVRIAAGNAEHASYRATRNDPTSFASGDDISVTPLRTPPPAQQDTQSSSGDFRTYTVTNTETGQARRFAATSEEDAITIGRREYPALFSTGNVTAQQSSGASSANDTRISDLRYYRVERQDTGGLIADVAASSAIDAMNRARERNPTWANSPLRAELL
jgi:hypothetical protein